MGTVSLVTIMLLVTVALWWQAKSKSDLAKRSREDSKDIMSKVITVLGGLALYYDGRHVVDALGRTINSRETTLAFAALHEKAKEMGVPRADTLITPTDIEDYDWEQKQEQSRPPE